MNILTKICVVVLLILVLVASVVFINMATVPQNYRAAYERERERANLFDQGVRVQKLVTNNQAIEIELLKQDRNGLASDMAKLKKSKVPDPTDLMVAKVAKKLETTETRLAMLQEDVKAETQRNDLLDKQLDAARDMILKLQKTNSTAMADITQLRGEKERGEREVRALQRQIQDRNEQIVELQRQVRSPSSATATAVTVPQGQVTGTITAVRGALASINVGIAQGVTRGQKLYIYRNASFVGYLRLDDVDEGTAAGTIVDKQLDPIVGDKVTNDLMK